MAVSLVAIGVIGARGVWRHFGAGHFPLLLLKKTKLSTGLRLAAAAKRLSQN